MTTIGNEEMAALSPEEISKVKRLLEKGVKIPPQPRVLNELRQQVMAGVFDIRILARIISQDPGLVALLFKAARSTAFRRYHPFENVEQILQALGIQQAFQLVQGAALGSVAQVKNNPKAYEAYWARSQMIAQLAMLVAAERVMVCNIFPEQAYLAGIFHDCGVPVLMQRFPTYCKLLQLDSPGSWASLAEEDKRFNADHCVVGYLLAKHWKLPEFICDAIRFHHDLNQLDEHDSRTMVAILLMAIHMYHLVAHAPHPEWEDQRAIALEELGIHSDDELTFIDEILEQFHAENQMA
jgi:HD-like signal output (HDOD) protein